MIFRILLVLLMALLGLYYATVAHHAFTKKALYQERNFFKLLIPFYGWYLLFKNK